MTPRFTIVLPAKNEAPSLEKLLPELVALYPSAEIVVVNDGSTDETAEVCRRCKVREVAHPYAMGNGAAIKSGARAAHTDRVVFMDADLQHDPKLVGPLLELLGDRLDMAVGARSAASQASLPRRIANAFYNRLASWMTDQHVADLTSGLRAVRRERFLEFAHLLPNGFSYPTTLTMAFHRAGYAIGYLPIEAGRRAGRSHISPLKDGARFLLIIFKIGTLYSPLKLFVPISFGFLALGLGYYAYTFLTSGRFTNMSALLFTTSVLVFLMGLVSEQITLLQYARRDRS